MALFDAHPRDRLQVFIDGQNIHGTLRALDRKIDWKVFMATAKEETRLIRAQYFTTIRPQQDNDKFNSVLDFLDFNGYQVEVKHVRDAFSEGGHMRHKGSMLMEIGVAMIEAASNNTDHLVLFSGDGELTEAVRACKRRDARVTIVSSESERVVSEDLRRACDNYVDILDLPPSVLLHAHQQFA